MKMLFKRSILIGLLFLSYFSHAQTKNGSVSGKIINAKDKLPIDYATVAVKSLKDSSVAGTTNTQTNGTFEITGLAPGAYRLYVAYLGLKSTTKDFTVTATSLKVSLGDIAMENTGLDLKTVEIKAVTPPVVVKKDTIEFNAGSYKVRENAVVEDVLKKLPGVEVAKDGSIKAQGETVTKVKVDGKVFFGNDPLLATRNLPADMIDKIQVIDQMSDQSQFTGVDDGNREKIINITTKKDMKNGFFGNSSGGYGSDDRYDVNVNVNRFKGEQQMSLIAQFNNVNKQSFGAGSGGGQGGQGGGGMRNMVRSLISGSGNTAPQGITTTNAVGFNFADVYTDQTQFSGSYFFNKTSLFNDQNSLTENLLGGDFSTTFRNALTSTTDKTNHRFNFLIDTKIDSLTSIRIEPDISYTETNLDQSENYTNKYSDYTTDGIRKYMTRSTTPTVNNNLLIRRKFLRRGRTLSLNVNTSINDNDATNYNNTINNTTTGTVTTPDGSNQLNDQEANSISNTSRVVYTEPLSKTLNVEINYENRYNFDHSDRYTYDFNPVTSQYDIVDQRYTNTYENKTLTNAAGLSFSKNAKKYNWNIGVAVQNTDRENTNLTTGDVLNQNFYNIVPSAQYRYTFSTTKRLRINYRGNTSQPSIAQIQPVLDNNNTQSAPIGNPGLKPSFTNNLSVFYNNFDFANFRSFFLFGNFTQTLNSFGNNSTLITDRRDPNFGKIAVLPINVDGVYSANLGSYLGLPIITENKLNLNINLNGGYSRNVNQSNSLENVTNNLNITNGYKLVSTFEKFDFTAGITGTYNRSTYSAQPASNTTYYTLNPTLDISYMFPGNIRLAADADYFQNTGRGTGFDNKYTLLNSYVSKQFFSNRGTFKFAVNDLLNQNQGVSTTSVNNTITNLNYNVLKRYYMLSFTYSLNKMGNRTMSNNMQMPGMGGGNMRTRM